MFKKDDVFSGKYTYQSVSVDGKMTTAIDKEKIKILEVNGNIFSVRIYFFYDFDKKKYNSSTLGIGIYNKKKNTFKIFESLYEEPITAANRPSIEVSLLKGEYNGNAIRIKFLEATNTPARNTENILYAYEAILFKR